MNLNNKTAIVTGGTKGIGRAIAEALIRDGASVCVTARTQAELEKTVRQLTQGFLKTGQRVRSRKHEGVVLGLTPTNVRVRWDGESKETYIYPERLTIHGRRRVIGLVCDVRKFRQVKTLIDHTVKELGGLDILVNNAGIGTFETVEETSPEDFRAVLETNLFGVFYCCHEAIPQMKKRGGGYIINISSLAGANPHPRMAAYNASKFGLNGFSEALMQEVRHDNIKVSYIMPGSVNTEFGGDSPNDEKSWQLTPKDIARVVVDLLHHDDRALPSRVEIRPSRPPKS
ncbi:MAG TPA: SDR family NAD(P)-dependent oxidoreductase [Pyrinomonadaceae bacterium]|nr:SDR family NAD(P)-dependent oxidoreductase [Pyrinomonadaceae bacterium]